MCSNFVLPLSYTSPIAFLLILTLHLMQDRENRLEKGISQEYLAGKLGVSSSTISRWESKGNSPSTDTLFEYASFLDLSCYDVLALLANEQPKPVGRIEISAYHKATFNRLVNLLLKEGGNDIDFTKTHLM